MGIVIEDMDATITPEPEKASGSAQEESQKTKESADQSLASSLQHWARRQLRVKAD